MKPIWFRFALAMLATGSTSFAAVDLSLWAAQPAPSKLRALAAVVTPAPTESDPVQERPARPPVLRSLFTPVGAAEPASTPDAPKASDDQLVLRGVIIAGPRRSALIATDAAGEGEWMEAGGRIAGALIEAIEPRQVFLRQGDAGFWISLATIGD